MDLGQKKKQHQSPLQCPMYSKVPPPPDLATPPYSQAVGCITATVIPKPVLVDCCICEYGVKINSL